jgi:hypothetical protein
MSRKTTAAEATAEPTAVTAAETAAPVRARIVPPRMGETVMVLVKPDQQLINQETGGYFAAGEPTPQTVTVTVLRRLLDGDLVLA